MYRLSEKIIKQDMFTQKKKNYTYCYQNDIYRSEDEIR